MVIARHFPTIQDISAMAVFRHPSGLGVELASPAEVRSRNEEGRFGPFVTPLGLLGQKRPEWRSSLSATPQDISLFHACLRWLMRPKPRPACLPNPPCTDHAYGSRCKV